jgi:hypothetical protein
MKSRCAVWQRFGLFITSMAAVQDFGPFWAFTAAARASAQIIGSGLHAGHDAAQSGEGSAVEKTRL